ncbi:MAG TPA: polyphosphate polymerase domain-containing protein [Polyangiaceae bacterium]|nr:polyphosphate polymerase domain-containing protein [Polyangiaceae bacterium]
MIVRFSRVELKYLLPRERCRSLIDDLSGWTIPDPHAGEQGYPVISLYYDSPELESFWAKIEGRRYRRKLRLRIYPGSAGHPGSGVGPVRFAAVEIKQRLDRTVQKRRLFLPLRDAEALCQGHSLAGLDLEQQQVAAEVTSLCRSLALRPTAITAYQRRAYQGIGSHAGLRVTFDENVAARLDALDLAASAPNQLILPESCCVLEVKADERVPAFLSSILAQHGCRLGRVSKYCTALAQLRTPSVLPLAHGPLPGECL